MKNLVSTLALAGLVMVLTATPIVQQFLHSAGGGVAYAAPNGHSGTHEPDGDNNDHDDGDVAHSTRTFGQGIAACLA